MNILKTIADQIAEYSHKVQAQIEKIKSLEKINNLDLLIEQMLLRITEFQQVCMSLVDAPKPKPTTIIVLCRSAYESLITLAYVLDEEMTLKDKELWSLVYCAFGIYNEIETYRDMGYSTKTKLRNLIRNETKITVWDVYRKHLSEDQLLQKQKGEVVTWNGQSIARTAKDAGFGKYHREWYAIMCQATHPNAAMLHKTKSPLKEDVNEWLHRISLILLSATILARKHYEIEAGPEEATLERFTPHQKKT